MLNSIIKVLDEEFCLTAYNYLANNINWDSGIKYKRGLTGKGKALRVTDDIAKNSFRTLCLQKFITLFTFKIFYYVFGVFRILYNILKCRNLVIKSAFITLRKSFTIFYIK